MPIQSDERPIDRWVDKLPETRFFKFVASRILVPLWARLTPVKPLPGGPHPSFQRGDNVQCMMNLIMPLKDKSPVGRALLDHTVGDVVQVTVPAGLHKYRIEKIERVG